MPHRARSAIAAASAVLVLAGAATGLGVVGAPPIDAAPAPSVLIVGDSVTVAAQSALVARLGSDHDLVIDAEAGRSTAAGPEIVAAATAAGAVDVLVVELGYNDGASAGAFAARVDAVLAAANADVIVWLTLREDDRNTFDYGPANGVLTTRAAAGSLRLLDWNAASQGDAYTWDGIHLTGAGIGLFVDLVDAAIATALEAGPRATCRPSSLPEAVPHPDAARGYWLLDSHGRVHPYGAATSHGDLISADVDAFPRSFQATASGDGYWIVDEDGRVHAFGDAVDAGDMSAEALNGPVRRIEAHPGGGGYWLVASDGGVFTFGDAAFHGSTGALTLRAPVVSLSATTTGDGYWLVASDGGVFTFGDAAFHGSTGALTLDAPVIDLAAHPAGGGYWLYASDGGVFSFGVDFHGSTPGMGLCELPTTVAMRVTATGAGYWLVTDRGWVLTFGDAVHYGDRPALAPGASIIDMAVLGGP